MPFSFSDLHQLFQRKLGMIRAHQARCDSHFASLNLLRKFYFVCKPERDAHNFCRGAQTDMNEPRHWKVAAQTVSARGIHDQKLFAKHGANGL